MQIFISYSFRPENAWVEDLVIPLVECFGHVPLTGRILDAGPMDIEVKRKIGQCKRVLCFVTRARPRFDATGAIVSYEPPDWVRDELMMSRGGGRDAIEFRETGVDYGGAGGMHAYASFDRNDVAPLLLNLARRLAEWPVGPLQLRLTVPKELEDEVTQAANAGLLKAHCVAFDLEGNEHRAEDLRVFVRGNPVQLVVPFWIRPDPNLSIEIELSVGASRLVCRGISPAEREARLVRV